MQTKIVLYGLLLSLGSVWILSFVLAPGGPGVTINYVALNSSSGNFLEQDDIWATTNLDGMWSSKLIYSWRRNSQPFASLILAFENDTNNFVQDYSGNGNNGSGYNLYVNATGGNDGFGAIELNGKNSSIVISDSASLRAKENLSICVWIKLKHPSNNYTFILEKGYNDSDNYAFFLDYRGGTRLAFEYNASSYHFFRTNPLGLVEGKWYFVAVSVNKSLLKFFVNGSLVGSFAINDPIIERNYNLFIGKQNYAPSDLYFNGTIDDLQIFRRALSEEQIYSIYKNRSKEVVSEDTLKNEAWSCCVVASDTVEQGDWVCSGEVSLKDETSPKINIWSPSSVENSTKLRFFLNVSISEKGDINYSVDGGENKSLCSSCVFGSGWVDVKDFGNHSVRVFAWDDSGNMNFSKKNFTLNRDTDGDGIPDSLDGDDDNDGILDGDDRLNGNESNVNTNLANFGILVGGSSNLSQEFNGTLLVSFRDGSQPIVEFYFNFSENRTLNLAEISVEKEESGDSYGKLLIRGINLEGTGFTKTVYLKDVSSERDKVCVKDEEVASINEMSDRCDGVGEVKVSCPGSNGGFSCEKVGGYYKVSGLEHSLIIETMDFNTNEQIPHTGHAIGGCDTDWICTEWGECINGTQKRTCEKEKEYCYAGEKPAEERECKKKRDIELKMNHFVVDDVRKLSLDIDLGEIWNDTRVYLKIVDKNGRVVYEESFRANSSKLRKDLKSLKQLREGEYRLIVSLKDENGERSSEIKFSIRKKRVGGIVDILVIFIFVVILLVWIRVIKNES